MKTEVLKNQVFLIVNMIKLKECFRLNNKQELIKIKMMHICKINYFCRQLGNQSFIIFAVINQNKYLKKKKNQGKEVI
jgi:hypothetical protein